MRDAALLGLRLTLGGYLAAHGSQKLFGALDGPGMKPVVTYFDSVGIRPGTVMAPLAAYSEFVGGLLTATGVAFPVGPIMIAGAMTVASALHAENGPMLSKDGYEQTATNLAAAALLIATGPGRYSLDRVLGLRIPRKMLGLTTAGAVALTALNVSGVVRARRQKALEARRSGQAGNGA